jgi:AraC-like DNA-binding protein
MITRRKDIYTLQEVRAFIESNFSRGILVENLCREFGLNRTKLQEGFNQLFGISVHAFVSKARMEKARTMLLETDDSIKAIAIDCGYRSASSFTRIFSRNHAMSPKEYRLQYLSNEKLSGIPGGSVN